MDKHLLSKEKAFKLCMATVEVGELSEQSVVNNAKNGFVPSGFENKGGVPRVSWMENESLALYLLAHYPYAEKEEVPAIDPDKEKKAMSIMERLGHKPKEKN